MTANVQHRNQTSELSLKLDVWQETCPRAHVQTQHGDSRPPPAEISSLTSHCFGPVIVATALKADSCKSSVSLISLTNVSTVNEMWHADKHTNGGAPCVIMCGTAIICQCVSARVQTHVAWLSYILPCEEMTCSSEPTEPSVSPVLLMSLFPSRLHPGGSARWWRASARLSSRRSHSCRGIWHSSSSSAPSRPSARPAVLTCVEGDYRDESSFTEEELRLSLLEALVLRRSA